MIKHFIEIRERVVFMERINIRRPSVKSPLELRSSFSPAKSISTFSMGSERPVDQKVKKEFKQSIQNKYKPENKPLERAMGASYFRNN